MERELRKEARWVSPIHAFWITIYNYYQEARHGHYGAAAHLRHEANVIHNERDHLLPHHHHHHHPPPVHHHHPSPPMHHHHHPPHNHRHHHHGNNECCIILWRNMHHICVSECRTNILFSDKIMLYTEKWDFIFYDVVNCYILLKCTLLINVIKL